MTTSQFKSVGFLHLAYPAPASPNLVIFDEIWEDQQGQHTVRKSCDNLSNSPFGVPKNATAALVQIKLAVRTHTTVPNASEGTAAVAIRAVPGGEGEYVAYASAAKATDPPSEQNTPRQESHSFVPVFLKDGRFELQCDYSIHGNIRIQLVVRLVGYYSADLPHE
jgi:guanyl-specific ribonuclease Sa